MLASSAYDMVCFNGAAAFRLRKSDFAAKQIAGIVPASMGPQPFDCGNVVSTTRPAGAAPASMGPQPFDCGNVPDVDLAKFGEIGLQWGRSLSTAEMMILDSWASSRLWRLQWGRSLSTAEMFAGPVQKGGWQKVLQWGRSLSTAEMHVPGRTTVEAWGLQWGRSLSTAEIASRICSSAWA